MTDPIGPAEDLTDRDIDKLVPPKIMRLAQHFHNLIYIRYFFESIGQQPPEWTKKEMTRADTALQLELEREHGQGGRLREMQDEARQSGQKRTRVVEAGTPFKRRL